MSSLYQSPFVVYTIAVQSTNDKITRNLYPPSAWSVCDMATCQVWSLKNSLPTILPCWRCHSRHDFQGLRGKYLFYLCCGKRPFCNKKKKWRWLSNDMWVWRKWKETHWQTTCRWNIMQIQFKAFQPHGLTTLKVTVWRRYVNQQHHHSSTSYFIPHTLLTHVTPPFTEHYFLRSLKPQKTLS